MITPVRLRLSRRAGFNLQRLSLATNGLSAVNVARPSKWGNPFTAKQARAAGYHDGHKSAAWAFRQFLGGRDPAFCSTPHELEARARILDNLSALRGKNLACWCKPGQPCHADVLLELANG